MKTSHIIAILTVLLFSISSNYAQTPKQPPKAQDTPAANQPADVTIRVTIVALPNPEALQFSAKQDLSGKPAEALDELEVLVREKRAVSVANLAVTTAGGLRGKVDSGKISVSFIPVVSPDGKIADITASLTNADHSINTHFVASDGAAKFLGSMQSPADKTMTEFVFARVSIDKQAKNNVATVAGEVKKPGNINLGETGKIDVLTAVAMAGGYSRIANQNEAILQRKKASGKYQMEMVRLKDVRNGKVPMVYINVGDILIIKESRW